MLGNLYPQMEGRKGEMAVEHFKRAAEKNSTSSGQVLEMLGELLATTDPAGQAQPVIRPAAEVSWRSVHPGKVHTSLL